MLSAIKNYLAVIFRGRVSTPLAIEDNNDESYHRSATVIAQVDPGEVVGASYDEQTVPYDVNLLERARTLWAAGDWAELIALDDTFDQHPDRGRLAVLVMSAYLQRGDSSNAKRLAEISIRWGVDRHLLSRFLVSGALNTLGVLNAIAGREQRALKHLEMSLIIGFPKAGSEKLLVTRVDTQLRSKGIVKYPPMSASAVSELPMSNLQTVRGLSTSGRHPFRPIAGLAKDMSKLSIIMPTYNVEDYVSSAIESVLSQTYDHFELIVVDDGSTDATASIVKRYKDIDSRIRFLEFESNCGVSVARNAGLDIASGSYIRFVDGDDVIPETSSEVLMRYAVNQDVVRASYRSKSLDGIEKVDLASKTIISDLHPFVLPYPEKAKLFYGFTATLFSRNFLFSNHIRFPLNKSMAEDAQFLIDVFFVANRCTVIPDEVYYYKKRKGSLSEPESPDKLFFLHIANKWMYLLSRAKESSQFDFAVRLFSATMDGYIRQTIFPLMRCLSEQDRQDIDSVFLKLCSDYGID